MTMSILHRVTGGALYFGTLLVAWWLIAAAALGFGAAYMLSRREPAPREDLLVSARGEHEERLRAARSQALEIRSEAEAVAIANNSLYGLSGSIWTRDIERALRVARAVETGVLSINSGSSVHLEAPFGGVKHSGVGRELGLAALEHYSELKSVFIHTGG